MRGRHHFYIPNARQHISWGQGSVQRQDRIYHEDKTPFLRLDTIISRGQGTILLHVQANIYHWGMAQFLRQDNIYHGGMAQFLRPDIMYHKDKASFTILLRGHGYPLQFPPIYVTPILSLTPYQYVVSFHYFRCLLVGQLWTKTTTILLVFLSQWPAYGGCTLWSSILFYGWCEI